MSVLTQERLERTFAAALPGSNDDAARLSACREELRAAIDVLSGLCRELLTSVMREQTAPWVRENGGRPISKAAVRLHADAHRAAVALARYLAGDDRALNELERELNAFLDLLAALLGHRLTELGPRIDRVLGGIELSPACREAAETVRQQHAGEVKRLDAALAVALAGMRRSFGVSR